MSLYAGLGLVGTGVVVCIVSAIRHTRYVPGHGHGPLPRSYGHDYVDIGERAYEPRFQARRLVAIAENAKGLGFRLIPDTGAA